MIREAQLQTWPQRWSLIATTGECAAVAHFHHWRLLRVWLGQEGEAKEKKGKCRDTLRNVIWTSCFISYSITLSLHHLLLQPCSIFSSSSANYTSRKKNNKMGWRQPSNTARTRHRMREDRKQTITRLSGGSRVRRFRTSSLLNAITPRLTLLSAWGGRVIKAGVFLLRLDTPSCVPLRNIKVP